MVIQEKIEFLKARLDEQERFAKAASAGPWWIDLWRDCYSVRTIPAPARDLQGDPIPGGTVHSEAMRAMTYVENSHDNAVFVVHHDPTYILADIAAKRAIIKLVPELEKNAELIEDEWGAGGITWGEDVIDAMLQPFADHDSFREEWKA